LVKRIFDIVFSFIGLVVLAPLMVLISLLIKFGSRGSIFFIQERIGKNGIPFNMIKFRTMKSDSEEKGKLTIGSRDPRITVIGYYLRKFKLDELPQLINVLMGEMSFVGPRPEVPKYVNMYTDEQKIVLSVQPGITDNASIEYRNENDLLENSSDPEKFYINSVMPDKLKINIEYINSRTFFSDTLIIFKTVFTIFKR
jgi:lipopolysaccharide/colanic/teichoic acid biosynthesis glycosyltransferase